MTATGGPAVTPDRIMQIAWSYAPPMILAAAINSRVFDVLDAGPKTAEALAVATGCAVRGLRPILNALVGFQFLTKDPDGKYALAPDTSAFLVRNKPGYLGAFVEFNAWSIVPRWQHLREAVTTGKPAAAVNQQDTGDEFFQQLVEPIFAMSYPATQVVGKVLGLDQAEDPVRVLDIGAGSGVWGIGLSQQSPKVSVTAVDFPGVLNVTRRMAERFNMASRFSYLAGDFHDVDFGTGHTLVTLGHILHSEGEQRSRVLLKKAFAALDSGGTIAISEFLVNQDRSGPPMSLIFAVNMMAMTDAGDTFSFEEISGWLIEAGFVNPRKIEPGGPVTIVVADRP
jgi:2-polyprenyl-3-methyl-5-hydroxy-6-metoxy-1,4-benzoquinol methylase